MKPVPLRIIFFDLGDTLVRTIAVSPVRFEWIPGAKDLLRRLRLAGLSLGLISNTGTITRRQLREALPSDFSFDVFESNLILLSSEQSFEKPDLRMFRLAVNRAQDSTKAELALQIDSADCLFVGESAGEVLAAQQVGMIGARVQADSQPADIGKLDVVLRDRGLLA